MPTYENMKNETVTAAGKVYLPRGTNSHEEIIPEYRCGVTRGGAKTLFAPGTKLEVKAAEVPAKYSDKTFTVFSDNGSEIEFIGYEVALDVGTVLILEGDESSTPNSATVASFSYDFKKSSDEPVYLPKIRVHSYTTTVGASFDFFPRRETRSVRLQNVADADVSIYLHSTAATNLVVEKLGEGHGPVEIEIDKKVFKLIAAASTAGSFQIVESE